MKKIIYLFLTILCVGCLYQASDEVITELLTKEPIEVDNRGGRMGYGGEFGTNGLEVFMFVYYDNCQVNVWISDGFDDWSYGCPELDMNCTKVSKELDYMYQKKLDEYREANPH